MNRTYIVIGIIVLLLVIGVLVWKFGTSEAPTVPTPGQTLAPPADDTTGAINQALDGVTLTDLNQEFQAIDDEINKL
ncbi:MAG: hypothetical protein A3A43_01850 [Candidatus Liptonbacteria bacterium RIFCSPLOWO2_01_FULL_56_20]|uniref:Uncharacterized protein n=1 Tax=Candidatus Liptonbacteria bacterium RIFCSPLOWO2_01_FULL_56_20 TaxID=1798652 RepID=A0A1G2CHN3_9BACT|nr:MAG: hypothetical protein A2681_01925 [Candidatus Liptonbacteria bacterium RIFCSPHIGHO2_01_FULL_56_18b]OGZ00909.1 MAG: hypothetical protein A3A43_01850 [Candidatus Liptonbacteria bacterium RIFCSPLOWO2_01_FULL_56_20]